MITSLIGLSITAVFILPTCMVLYVILRNNRAADLYYQGLCHNLEQERLGKLLRSQGIDLNHYVRSHNSVEIFKEIKRCRHCEVVESCDNNLHSSNRMKIPDDCANKDELINSAAALNKQDE